MSNISDKFLTIFPKYMVGLRSSCSWSALVIAKVIFAGLRSLFNGPLVDAKRCRLDQEGVALSYT